MEKELLSIVMALKEFCSMLLGAEVVVHTDYNNVTVDNLMTQKVLCWRCYAEEHSPTIKYIKGHYSVDYIDNVNKSTIMYENFHSIMDDPDIAEYFFDTPC